MKKTITLLFSLTIAMIYSFTLNAQVLLNEQFDYPVGDSLTPHGWTAHSGGVTNYINMVSGSLSYSGYCNAVGNKASMTVSGQDVNHLFTAPTSGSIYIAFLVNITTATATGDYFLHLKDPSSTSLFAAKVYVKAGATSGTVLFGCSKAGTSSTPTVVYSTTEVPMSATHLLVLKYAIGPGTADDQVSLFIDPATSTEGTATVTATDNAANDLAGFGAIALRQGGSTAAAALTIDGIRIGATWADAIGFNGVITAPVIASGTTTNITSNSSTCAGNVTSDGGSPVTQRGICYGSAANPDTLGSKVVVAGTVGTYTGDISGLTSGTLYHYRAYAINTMGVSYGADSTFSTVTGAVAPIVSTGAISSISTATAVAGGNVVNDGGSTILLRGLCFGTALNPDTSGTKVVISGTTGIYSGNLTGLTGGTVYHVRAFAINAIGISYGADVNFTTLIAGIPIANIAALRAQNADNSTVYNLTGEAVLSFKQAYKNEKFIQDATGAIMIYDAVPATGVITTVYNIGDGITGIKGKLQNYFNQLEFIPIYDPGPATSTGNTLVPFVVTATQMYDSVFMFPHQSQLIKITGTSFVDANGTAKFGVGKKYKLSQTGAPTDSLFYCNFYDADYCATATAMVVPVGSGDITGIAIWSKSRYYITARDRNDISLLNGVNELDANKIDIYPNPSENIFNVSIPSGIIAEVNTYSATGEIVFRKTTNESLVEIDMSNQPSGIYVIQVRDVKNGISRNVKVIKK